MKLLTRAVQAALLLVLCASAPFADAAVVRPAPNFTVQGVRKDSGLRSFRGQTVVLLITHTSRDKNFRAMLYRLHQIYDQFANEKVVFVAAIENGADEVKSDIPFITASNPAQVAADYGVAGRFGLAVIGKDGNLDLITANVISPNRVRDMVFNNYETQSAARKQPTVEN